MRIGAHARRHHHVDQVGEILRPVAERADFRMPRAALRAVAAMFQRIAVAFRRAGALAVPGIRTRNIIVPRKPGGGGAVRKFGFNLRFPRKTARSRATHTEVLYGAATFQNSGIRIQASLLSRNTEKWEARTRVQPARESWGLCVGELCDIARIVGENLSGGQCAAIDSPMSRFADILKPKRA